MAANKNPSTAQAGINILTFNARGVKNKLAELEKMSSDLKIDIIAIQETGFHYTTKIHPPGFLEPVVAGNQTNRNNKAQTTLLWVNKKHEIKEKHTIADESGEYATALIELNNGKQLTVTSFYRKINRDMTTSELFKKNLKELTTKFPKDHYITGDINIKSPLWQKDAPELTEQAHKEIENYIYDENLIVLNNGKVTRLGQINQKDSALDVTLVKNPQHTTIIDWDTVEDTLGSDHFPTITSLTTTYQVEPEEEHDRIKYRTKNINWDKYIEKLKTNNWELCKSKDPAIYTKNILETWGNIARQTIPHNKDNRRKPKHKTVPWWTQACTEAKKNKLKALKEYQKNKTERTQENYRKARNKCNEIILTEKKKHWQDFCTNINLKEREAWTFYRNMQGTAKGSPKVSTLQDNEGKKHTTNKEKADLLANQFEFVSSDDNLDNDFKKKKTEHIENNKHLFLKKINDHKDINKPLKIKEVEKTLRLKKDSSPGLDGITYKMFKKAPKEAKKAITDLFNVIWETGEIPQEFKHGIVVPIRKPDKKGSDPASYRPISLTSALGKILETIINRRLTRLLEKLGIIHKNQSGFRRKRQVHDHIIRLTNEVNKGRDRGNRPIAAIFIDMEKAFDTLWREGTLEELENKGITGNTYNYIKSYLSDRTFQVRVGDTLSDSRTQINGTPQGGVLSPTIFNILINKVNDITTEFPDIGMGQLADDNAIWTTTKALTTQPRDTWAKTVKKTIEKPTIRLIEKLKELGFKVNVPKTQAIIFNTNEEITLNLRDQQVKTQKTAKYLGVTFDKHLNFIEHINNLKKKANRALNVLRITAGKKWGVSPKSRTLLYKNMIRPKLEFCQEIYDQGCKKTLGTLDLVQNAALRIITNSPQGTCNIGLAVATGIEPLEIRRKETIVNLWARIKTNPKNPAGEIYKEKIHKTRRARKRKKPKIGIVETTQNLLKNMTINENHVTELKIPEIEADTADIRIDKELTNVIKKNDTPAEIMKSLTREHIDKNYSEHAQIYTDGSKENDRVGYGIYCKKDQTRSKHRITDKCAIATAELIAILDSIEHAITNHKGEKIAVITDSLAAIQAIEKEDLAARSDLTINIINKITELTNHNSNCVIVWVPSHIGLAGNEIADKLANEGKNLENVTVDCKLGIKEIKTIVRKEIRIKLFQKLWNETKKSKLLKKIIPNVHPLQKYTKKTEKITRLRLNVAKFAITRNRYCIKCRKFLSQHHALIDCQHFAETREQIRTELNRLGLELTQENILNNERSATLNTLVHKLTYQINKRFEI